jgi:hypothetical protein
MIVLILMEIFTIYLIYVHVYTPFDKNKVSLKVNIRTGL